MNKPKKNYFFPENEYTRYVIGRFSNEEFVPRMLRSEERRVGKECRL